MRRGGHSAASGASSASVRLLIWKEKVFLEPSRSSRALGFPPGAAAILESVLLPPTPSCSVRPFPAQRWTVRCATRHRDPPSPGTPSNDSKRLPHPERFQPLPDGRPGFRAVRARSGLRLLGVFGLGVRIGHGWRFAILPGSSKGGCCDFPAGHPRRGPAQCGWNGEP